MKTLRIYQGGEFISTLFTNYYKEKGIKRQLIVHHTPEQNEVAKYKNWIIVEIAQSMLKEKELPSKFWIETINTTIFILNQSPTKLIQNKTLYEAWYRQKS